MKTFLIVGGGILGASTAYHLAKAGAAVTVIDRKDAGQATDAAAGIICPWISQRRNKAWYALAKGGAAYYDSLITQLEADGETETGYRRVGAISLHTEGKKLEGMEERALKRREDAPEMGQVRRLTAEETTAEFPPLDESFQSVHVSGAARVNGRALRNALMNGAMKHGAKVIEGSAELLMTEAREVIGVVVGEQRLEADSVLVTAGAWAKELFTPLGIDLEVKGQKAQIVHLELEQTETSNWPVVMPPTNQYILAFDDGKIVMGATHEDDVEGDCRVTAGGLHETLDKALAIAPGLADGTLTEARVGFRPFTPNFLPIIGELPDTKGILLANGLGASGLTVGPYLGRQLAKLALGEELEIDLALYGVSEAISW